MLCLSHLGLNPSGIDFYVDYEVGIHFIILLSLWASLVAQMVKKIRLQCRRPGFNPWVGKIPWRRERLATPVFWPEEFQACKESGKPKNTGVGTPSLLQQIFSTQEWNWGVPTELSEKPRKTGLINFHFQHCLHIYTFPSFNQHVF